MGAGKVVTTNLPFFCTFGVVAATNMGGGVESDGGPADVGTAD